jgi:phosphoribosylformylglycinamidine synthase subunit PurL
VGMVGLVPDLSQTCGQGWRGAGDLIYLLGIPLADVAATGREVTLGASEYLAVLHGQIAGIPPLVNFELERRVQAACRDGIRQGWVRSAHDCAEGGVAVAIAESCITGNLGATLNLPAVEGQRLDHLLFAEGGARIMVSVAPTHRNVWEAWLPTQLGDRWQALGQVVPAEAGLVMQTPQGQRLIDLPLTQLSDRWSMAIDRYFVD